jgi:hypothetical protein
MKPMCIDYTQPYLKNNLCSTIVNCIGLITFCRIHDSLVIEAVDTGGVLNRFKDYLGEEN